MAALSPESYLDLIDKQYREAKKLRISRLDSKWGTWSGRMNRKLRRIIDGLEKTGVEDDLRRAGVYKMVFMFWLHRSRMLEIWHRGAGFFGQAKMRREANCITDIRKHIAAGECVGDIDLSSRGIADAMFDRAVGIIGKGAKRRTGK